jgi:hypothetical protein
MSATAIECKQEDRNRREGKAVGAVVDVLP